VPEEVRLIAASRNETLRQAAGAALGLSEESVAVVLNAACRLRKLEGLATGPICLTRVAVEVGPTCFQAKELCHRSFRRDGNKLSRAFVEVALFTKREEATREPMCREGVICNRDRPILQCKTQGVEMPMHHSRHSDVPRAPRVLENPVWLATRRDCSCCEVDVPQNIA